MDDAKGVLDLFKEYFENEEIKKVQRNGISVAFTTKDLIALPYPNCRFGITTASIAQCCGDME